MAKNIAIIILVILLVVCGLWGIISNARNYHAIRAVQAENYRLQYEIMVRWVDIAELNEIIGVLRTENTALFNLLAEFEAEELAEQNRLDKFFDELHGEIHLNTTLDMVSWGTILASVWRAEMLHFYEILAGLTQNEFVRKELQSEKQTFAEYLRHRAEIEALLVGSNAFWEDDEILSVGSIARVVRQSEIAHGYREKALQLYSRLDMLRQNPQFIFDANAFYEHIRQEFSFFWE